MADRKFRALTRIEIGDRIVEPGETISERDVDGLDDLVNAGALEPANAARTETAAGDSRTIRSGDQARGKE